MLKVILSVRTWIVDRKSSCPDPIQLRPIFVANTSDSGDYLDYLNLEVMDYVSIISKVARTMEIRNVAFPIPRSMMADNDNVSSSPLRSRSLTKATSSEGPA
jgi:hypothetical protein